MNAAKTSETNKTRCLDVAIVGAGFGGLGLAIRLKQNGIDNFRIFDKALEGFYNLLLVDLISIFLLHCLLEQCED